MFLYLRSYGQLCNRIWSILPPLSLAIERDEKINVLFVDRNDLHVFPMLKCNKYVRFLTKYDNRIVSSLLYRLFNFLDVKGDLANSKINSKGIYVINGWKHSCDQSFIEKHKRKLIDIFSIKPEVEKVVDDFLLSYDGVTIGVHVRRGDYKQWRKGFYFFNDEAYLTAMQKIALQINAKKISCRFLICSNEEFNYSNSRLNIIRIPNASGIVDLCALSKCDYIIGPPSSFSQWASFYGNVPYYCLLQPNNSINLDEFSPIIGMNVFQSGKHIVDLDGIRFKIE